MQLGKYAKLRYWQWQRAYGRSLHSSRVAFHNARVRTPQVANTWTRYRVQWWEGAEQKMEDRRGVLQKPKSLCYWLIQTWISQTRIAMPIISGDTWRYWPQLKLKANEMSDGSPVDLCSEPKRPSLWQTCLTSSSNSPFPVSGICSRAAWGGRR